MAIDVIYAVVAILKEKVAPYKEEIVEVLHHCRFDKVKPVREVAIETLNLMKELVGYDEPVFAGPPHALGNS